MLVHYTVVRHRRHRLQTESKDGGVEGAARRFAEEFGLTASQWGVGRKIGPVREKRRRAGTKGREKGSRSLTSRLLRPD